MVECVRSIIEYLSGGDVHAASVTRECFEMKLRDSVVGIPLLAFSLESAARIISLDCTLAGIEQVSIEDRDPYAL